MSSNHGPHPTNGASRTHHTWASFLKDAANDRVILGKTSDSREIRHFKTEKDMGKAGFYEASITEVYDYSKHILEKPTTSHKQKQRISKHLATLIKIETSKLQDKIKEMNSTWLTALKIFMVATVILIPVAAFLHLAQADAREIAQNELTKLNDRLLLQNKKETFIQESNDIVDLFNGKKSIDDIKLRPARIKKNVDPIFFIQGALVDNKKFADDERKSSLTQMKSLHSTTIKPAVIEDNKEIQAPEIIIHDKILSQFYKDINRNYIIEVAEEIPENGGMRHLYTNKTREETEEANTKKEFSELEFAEEVVNNLNQALGDDASRWSKPIQSLCVQGTFFDTQLLTFSRDNNQWKDSTGVEHQLNIKHPEIFNVLIKRNSEDASKIEKVTISLNTPIALTHTSSNTDTVEKLDHSLTYHLSMEVTLNEQNEPQINVTRREFTKGEVA